MKKSSYDIMMTNKRDRKKRKNIPEEQNIDGNKRDDGHIVSNSMKRGNSKVQTSLKETDVGTYSHSNSNDKDPESYENTPRRMKSNNNSNKIRLNRKLENTLTQINKQARQAVLDSICEVLESDKSCSVNQVLEECKADHPWMTRFIINQAQEKHRVKSEKQVEVEVEVEETKQQNKREDPSSICSISIDTMENETLSSGHEDPNASTQGSTEKREGRKKRKRGEPRRKFATLYHVPEGAEHAVDITRVCHSASSLNKLKQSEKSFLADAYQQMNDAKQEYDDAKALLDQYESQHQHHSQIVADTDDKIKNQLQIVKTKEEVIQKASDYVTEQELNVDCPWNTNYRKLCQYKELHGNIDLPTRCQEDKEMDSLCCWIQAQKQKYQDYREGCKITFKPYRILLLEKLGIEWNVRNNLWNKHFQMLIQFKEEFGHVIVPTKTPPPAYKDLAAWVVYQRDQYKSIMDETVRKRRPVKAAVSLTLDRIQRLKDIGFVFNVFDERWDAMYLELKHSNRNYASFKKTAPKLHHWVGRQRYEYELYNNGQRENKRCRLTPERIRLLNELDFPWKACDEINIDEAQKVEMTSSAGPDYAPQSYNLPAIPNIDIDLLQFNTKSDDLHPTQI